MKMIEVGLTKWELIKTGSLEKSPTLTSRDNMVIMEIVGKLHDHKTE